MAQVELTKVASGILGISQPIGTDLAVITTPGPGRYQVWGTARHTLADGCRVLIGATTVIPFIAASANKSQNFGPIVVDVLNSVDSIILELALATGGADAASGIIYAQKL